MSVVGTIIGVIALIGYDAIGSIEAFVTIMIVTLHAVDADPGDRPHPPRWPVLHPRPAGVRDAGRNGVYHFTNGVNWRALGPWAIATVAGILFSETSIYTGPMAKHVNGVDISFVVAGIVGAVLYFIAIKVWPEHGVTPGVGEPSPDVIGMAE